MVDLGEDRRAMAVDRVGDASVPGNHVTVEAVDELLVRPVRRMRRVLLGDDQPGATRCSRGVVGGVLLGRLAVARRSSSGGRRRRSGSGSRWVPLAMVSTGSGTPSQRTLATAGSAVCAAFGTRSPSRARLKPDPRRADRRTMIGSDVTASMEAPMLLDLLPVGVAVIDVYGIAPVRQRADARDDRLHPRRRGRPLGARLRGVRGVLQRDRHPDRRSWVHRPHDGSDPAALPGRRRPAPGDRDVGAELSGRGGDRRLRGDVRRGVGERPHVARVRVDLERRGTRADPAGGHRLDGGASDGGNRGRGVAGARRPVARR